VGTSDGTAPRRAALALLQAVRSGTPFDRALERLPEELSDRDRRFAHEVAAGVLRHQNDLDRILGPLSRHGWASVPQNLKDVLRIGAYQLRHLDRVPPHAAVSTTVALARASGGKGQAGFVNAVLRRVGAAPASAERGHAAAGPAALASEFSHPEWLVARWLERFGAGDTRALLEWNNRRPPLVLQPGRESLPDIRKRLVDGGVPADLLPGDAGLVVSGGRPASFPGYREGAFIVQDPAQAWVVRFGAIPPGSTVLDVCAAPGGKTVALSRNAGLVVAAEWRHSRIARLRANLDRAARGPTAMVLADGAHPPVREVDAVLVDAPCSATGTFARHPDARHRITPEDVERMVRIQTAILAGAATAVRPGGLLVYATCSLEPEENELQVERFLARWPEFRREPGVDLPDGMTTPAGDLVILPQRHGMDGAYAVRLRRADP